MQEKIKKETREITQRAENKLNKTLSLTKSFHPIFDKKTNVENV